MSATGPLWRWTRPLVLASGSTARAQLLKAVQIPFVVDKPSVDERAVEAPMLAAGANPSDIAAALADAKSLDVSRRRSDDYIIGSDQTLELAGLHLTKASAREEAIDHLRRLSGRTHELYSAASIVRGGQIISRVVGRASLTMRHLSDEFIETYLDLAGASILGSVGVYQIEGLGLQLFDRIEGDHATIMGLPLLPLLSELRRLSLLRA